jgi:HSP20 family protein
MALIPYRPFRELEQIFEEWASKFHEVGLPEFFTIEEPKMDIYEADGKVVAKIEMPGIDPKSIDVSIENNLLRVEGKKEEKVEEKKKGYYRKELKSGYLKRVVSLPLEVVGEKAQASYQNGLLTVEVPKVKEAQRKKKKIKVKIKK